MTWLKLAVDICQIIVGLCALLSLILSLSIVRKEYRKQRRKRYKKSCPKFVFSAELPRYVDEKERKYTDLCILVEAVPKKQPFLIKRIELVRPSHGTLLPTSATNHFLRRLWDTDIYPDSTQYLNFDLTHRGESSLLEVDWCIPSRETAEDREYLSAYCVRISKERWSESNCLEFCFKDRNNKTIAKSKIIVEGSTILKATTTNIPEKLTTS